MIDFIKATKYNCKDSNLLANCKPKAHYPNGWDYYTLQGCEKMQVGYNADSKVLRLEGSLPYFLKGHNWRFSTEEFVQAVELIDILLGNVGLWQAELNTFENGVIIPTDEKAKEYIAKHSAQRDSHLKLYINEKDAGKLAIWQRQGLDLKMYDAGANILMKQGMHRRRIIESEGWNPDCNYLKFESRYLKPEMLNKGRALPLEMLQNGNFINMLKGELMENYHLLTPQKTLVLPTDKKELSSIDAVLITFAEMQGLPLDALKMQIYSRINKADCLSKADKDARKAQIRKCFARLQESPESQWDLTDKIEEALDAEI